MNSTQNLDITDNKSTMQNTNLTNLPIAEHQVGPGNSNNSNSRQRNSANQAAATFRNPYGRNIRRLNNGPQSQPPITGSTSQINRSNQDAQTSNRNLGSQQRGVPKHRQRKKTHQLIEGMSSLVPLEIGLQDGELQSNQRSSGRNNIRKMNLTHMINRSSPDGRNINRNYSNQRRNKPSSYRDPGVAHKFSKQQFLQANCQFVVLNGYDYSIHLVDPDWPVDWECIEEIKFKQCATTETTCPICLESPVAAKITKCGHIYCWTCMLHYLSLSDDKCRQCPICFEFVYKNDLRSVVSHSFIAHMVDADIEMRLMVRKKGCVTVEPYITDYLPEDHDNDNELIQKQSTIDYCSQQNLFAVDSDTVIAKIIDREYRELSSKLNTDQEEPEVCFIEQALKMLEERRSKLMEMSKTEKVVMPTQPEQNFESNRQAQNSLDLSNSYLFYQSRDGQHIYLNPFSTKILCHEYNSLENCPLEIKAKVLQMDWISMSEAWRKRFRYLGHLPLTCEFRLVEIDFEKSNLISKSTFDLFADQIKSRETARERLRREERKREKIIRVEQDRKIYGIQPSLKININNPDQFPSVSDERYIGLSLSTTDHGQVDETFGMSSDDESEPMQRGLHNQIPAIDSSISDPQTGYEATVSSVALSFRDIQLQEAAAADAYANLQTKQGVTGQSSSWGRGVKVKPTSDNHNNQQASASGHSFAQLLLNAKTSKQEWTVKPSSSRAFMSSNNGPKTLSSNNHHSTHDGFDDQGGDEEEELKAPGNFTISDFIDNNVVSSTSKKLRGKQRATTLGNGKK